MKHTHTIFSNYYWENDETGKDMTDYTREYLFEIYADDEGWETEDDISDDRVWDEMYRQSECDWDDFEHEFNHFLKNSRYGFVLTGDIGRWDGRCDGGCLVNDFHDLYKFWDGCRDIKVWDEDGHLYIKATHHDGTNYAELKEITSCGRDYINDHQYDPDWETFGTVCSLNFYSRLPRYAKTVYGC